MTRQVSDSQARLHPALLHIMVVLGQWIFLTIFKYFQSFNNSCSSAVAIQIGDDITLIDIPPSRQCLAIIERRFKLISSMSCKRIISIVYASHVGHDHYATIIR